MATSDNQNPEIDQWLAAAKSGELSWSEFAERILQYEHQDAAPHRPDRDRRRRCHFGEVIFGSGKSADDIRSIAGSLLDSGQAQVLATRVAPEIFQSLSGSFPGERYDEAGRTLRLSRSPINDPTSANQSESDSKQSALIAVVTAGSTDYPVASEAVETLHWMSVATRLITDVGVAGPYRLLPHLEQLRKCSAVVVVAGMEGALASVVGGLVPCPIIAVPTSVGYGSNFEGITTLLSMMSSCAAGVTVVNIDGGFKGGYVAGLIAHQIHSMGSRVTSHTR